MENDKKGKNSENKLCFILHSITAIIFMATGILNFVTYGVSQWTYFTSIALGITFGCLAIVYYKKYKEENKK